MSKMTLGKCYEVTFTTGEIVRFKVLGGEEVLVELGDGSKELLDILMARPFKTISEYSCEEDK